MRSSFLSWIRGFVQVGIRGENTERLVNRLLQKGMEIWDIHRAEEGRLRLNIHISDFFRIRPLLKETGCRLHVEKRSGFPFLLDKLEKRKSFAAGFLLFLAGLFLLSNLVWQVEVEGLETLKEEEILEAAESVGIYSGQWLFRLPEPDTMSEQLMQKVPGVSWIGVKTEGTKVRIRVVESTSPEERPLVNPRHLVAATDAVISNIYAEKGKPVVRPNTRVKKGDVLISGIVGDEENRDIVAARGEVRGWVWYEYEVLVPLIHKRKVLTGKSFRRRYLLLGNRALQVTGYGAPDYAKAESSLQKHVLNWRGWTLPVGWIDERVREATFYEERWGWDKARQLGLQRSRSELLLAAGEDAVITDEQVLRQEKRENALYLKVLFEVEQEIGEERPIVSTDLAPPESSRESG